MIGHRCIDQDLPGANNDCTCPPPEPEVLKVFVLVDHVAYEGDNVMGVFYSRKEAFAWAGQHIDDFAGEPEVNKHFVLGEAEE
jgi:hypothetical protein